MIIIEVATPSESGDASNNRPINNLKWNTQCSAQGWFVGQRFTRVVHGAWIMLVQRCILGSKLEWLHIVYFHLFIVGLSLILIYYSSSFLHFIPILYIWRLAE